MRKLKVNDEVVVLKGRDQGKIGKIRKLDWKNNRVLVEGVNIVKKAVRPTQQNPNGGIQDIENSVHLSNVAVVSPKNHKATRVRIETKDNKKVRVAVSCGTILD